MLLHLLQEVVDNPPKLERPALPLQLVQQPLQLFLPLFLSPYDNVLNSFKEMVRWVENCETEGSEEIAGWAMVRVPLRLSAPSWNNVSKKHV